MNHLKSVLKSMLACVLIAFSIFSCPPLSAQENKTGVNDAPATESAASDENGAVVSKTPDADSDNPAAEAVNWTQKLDGAFGDYLVSPVASVLFFDFGTGPTEKQTTDKDGQTTTETLPGWLITPAYPNGISVPFVVVWLLFGATFLTLRMGFINFRAFRHAIDLTRGIYDSPNEQGDVSHFQALSAALSATVGLGNIAGVAIAIGLGGPGATFWIIMIGLIGMTAKFSECTLGQIYRVKDSDGHVLGGPMRYLKFGLADMGMAKLGKVLSLLFMILCVGASFGGGNAFQVGQSLEAIRGEVTILQDYPYLYGIVMAIAVGSVILGGIKSIGAVAGKLVPVMCVAYVSAALYILAINVSEIPAAITQIITEAFSPQAAYGGFLGVVIIGVQRAVFSNEAGVGSAAIAHSAAKTDEPVSEGIVALLEPFIDTVLVCTITALVLVVSGAYDAETFVDRQSPATVIAAVQGSTPTGEVSPSDISAAKESLQETIETKRGAAMTLVAFRSCGYTWFGYILFGAVVLFAFSTCISWSYYGERCWVEMFGEQFSIVYKLLFLVFTILGSIVTRGNILEFSDLMILGMSFPNLLGVFLLSGLVKRRLDEYWGKYKSGEMKPYTGKETA
ncbi:alanine:cation symporter family protein [Rubripirellula sp.]|nr:alanine:cation symporter family protein [Rubripirellula sp.]